MALIHRCPPAGLVHHSDRGSQYAARAYQRLLKAECITDVYATRAEARHDIVDYIAVRGDVLTRHRPSRLESVSFSHVARNTRMRWPVLTMSSKSPSIL